MKGKLGIAVGLAAGYVLGTRAGRERYQQLTASAKRFADQPSLQRLQDELNGLFGSGREDTPDSSGSSGTTVERV
ncbi:MAG TPA: YtxH domain-containing protein, partial [Actinomycetota bacterium]|nr:YtxH domain-containing protein [Actinomycetota bacterium]